MSRAYRRGRLRSLVLRSNPSQSEITSAQRRLGRLPVTPRQRSEYLRIARWWELESRRGYPSAADSLFYSKNMRWAVELTSYHGDGTWRELMVRLGAIKGQP